MSTNTVAMTRSMVIGGTLWFVLPLILILVFLPNALWGIIVKIVIALILLNHTRWAFNHPPFRPYAIFGWFNLMNILFFLGFFFSLRSHSAFIYFFGILVILNFYCMLRKIDEVNRKNNQE